MDNRFIIGIDLGTTQCALSYADLEDPLLKVKTLQIPQLVNKGMVEEVETLPSVIWLEDNENIIGTYAKELGAQNQDRYIHSSKSWLCHPRAERTSPILPWQSNLTERKMSPVDAATELLKFLGNAWNNTIGKDNTEFDFYKQKIIVTVPASFDPVARNLTLEAIEKAGITNVALLEEPQAAFYDYLQRNPKTMVAELQGVDTVLVVDVGGGTTDFSLIKIEWNEKGNYPEFKRLAVGPHLLIGGDNLDLALARSAEAAFKHKGVKIANKQWLSLLAQSRTAKEKILSKENAEKASFTITGAGSKVFGGSSKVELDALTVEKLLVDGFFPLVEANEFPDTEAGLGLSEAGLPFTQDPSVTKHLAAFLKNNEVMPDAVLFNGGTLKAECLRKRISDVLSIWHGSDIKILENPHPILAVAAGAAYYGLCSVGYGRRIQSGSAVSIYLGIGNSKSSTKEKHVPEQLVCLLTKGAETETDYDFSDKVFGIDLSRDSAFYLFYTPNPPKAEQAGRIIKFNSKRYLPLPPVMLKARTGKGEKEVKIQVKLRETGYMQMFCEEINGGFKQELRFGLEETEKTIKKGQIEENKLRIPVSAIKLKAIDELISSVLENKTECNKVLKELEEIIGSERNDWDVELLRRLFDIFASHKKEFEINQNTLDLFFRIGGWCLRPGFGATGDTERIDLIWSMLLNSYDYDNLEFWTDWWVMLKRIAPGLSVERQNILMTGIEHLLTGTANKGKKTSITSFISGIDGNTYPCFTSNRKIVQHERNQLWRLLGALERISAEEKERLGWKIIQTPMCYGVDASSLVTLGRLGTRILTYAPDSAMVSKSVADAWAEALIKKAFPGSSFLDTALRELGRKTGDRLVQIDDNIRKNIIEIFKKKQRKKQFIQPILKAAKLEDKDLAEITGDVLPSGFVWAKEVKNNE